MQLGTLVRHAPVVLVAVLATSCQTTSNGADGSGSSSSGGGSSGSCGSVADRLEDHSIQFTASPLPVATGGTFADGIYVMTAFRQHTTASGGPYLTADGRVTTLMSSGGYESIYWYTDMPEPRRVAGRMEIDGVNFVRRETCPHQVVDAVGQFSATASGGFTMIIPGSGKVFEFNRVE